MKSFSTFRPTALMAAMLLIMPAAYAVDTQQLATSKMSAINNQETDTYDRFIIAYREGSGIRNPSEVMKDIQFAVAASGVDRMASRSGTRVQPLTATYKRKLGVGSDLIQTSRKLDTAEANALMQKIAANPDVLYVEPDRKLRIDDVSLPTFPSMRTGESGKKALPIAPLRFTPNDPYYNPYQWNFYAPGYGSANINNAWDLSNGAGVTVAVIDSGIAPNPDIDDAWICDGYNFSSDDGPDRDKCGRDPGHPQSSGMPSTWHGTKVSGIINAKTNNEIGLAGVAYNARLIPIRTVPWDGAYVSDVVDSIEWASGGHVDGIEDAEYPAQVINMSFGTMAGPCSTNQALGQAVERAINRNVVLVASAGNNNADNANHIPSSCPGVIAVAATDYFGSRASRYSNYGAAVALAAPVGGANSGDFWEWSWLLSNSGAYAPNPDNTPHIAGDVGTSFAAPLVAGTVALMINARHNYGLPPATPAQIRNWLTSSTHPFPQQPDHPIGSGILDAHAAIVKALDDRN